MRWKQFFTPAKSFDAADAKNYMSRTAADAFTLLDVRQPEEYESEHLPGAKLIPLPELSGRLAELDAQKPTIVYCAIGGRSRVAAQVLAAKGFREVFNLTGGIKAWSSGKAVGPQDLGLGLFSGKETPEETLVVAYALEEGLFEFYQSMAPKVTNENARRLFGTLATIEVKHQDRIFNEYIKVTGAAVSRRDFAQKTVTPAMEGGGLRPPNTSTGINRTWKRQKRLSRWPWRSRPRRWTFISARPMRPKRLKAKPCSGASPTKNAPTWSNWASCLGNYSIGANTLAGS
jgi:sulfur-carrier protein adenylyltransferase/sulfurtransferase